MAARRDATRRAILRAAATTFRTRGFAGAGMRDIALVANLSAANLYHYFRGKDEILFYCQDRALDRMLAGVERARRSKGPVPDRVRQILADHIRILLDEVEGATAHLQTDALSPELRARIVRKRDRYERALRDLVAAGTVHDPALVVRAMLGAANWTATWFKPAGPKSVDAVANETADFLVAGLTRPRSSHA
jgi:AcrR family transcriptional regulator